jgi:hypothetical protein
MMKFRAILCLLICWLKASLSRRQPEGPLGCALLKPAPFWKIGGVMIISNKRIFVFLASSFLVLFFACQQPGPSKSSKSEDRGVMNESIGEMESPSLSDRKESQSAAGFRIKPLSFFPEEISGCYCYFSNNSEEFEKGVYIYADNYAETSFLNIDGVMTKFRRTEFQQVNSTTTMASSISGRYTMIIEIIKGERIDFERWLTTGTIKVYSSQLGIVTLPFYGECGC